MFGAGLNQAIQQQERRREFEARRKKWVEVREEGDKLVEYFMVKCEHCAQAWPRQRVLRFNELELREWRAMEEKFSSMKQGFALIFFLAPFALFALSIAIWLITGSILCAIVPAVTIVAPGFYFIVSRDARLTNEFKEKKRRILERYGNIPENKVGMINDHYTDYVILETHKE